MQRLLHGVAMITLPSQKFLRFDLFFTQEE